MKLELTKSINQIERDLLKILRDEIQQRWKQAMPRISDEARRILDSVITDSDEYKSLLPNGDLSAEFGLPRERAEQMVDAVKQQWLKEVKVTVDRLAVSHNNQITGALRLRAINHDLANVLSLPEASYEYVSDRFKANVMIPWLEWLLTAGDAVIVPDYRIQFNPGLFANASRSGRALMYKSLTGSTGWHVPPNFSGTTSKNWTHKFINVALPQIEAAIQGYL